MVDEALLHHPYWKESDRRLTTVVLVSNPLPPELTGFPASDRIEFRVAGVPGSSARHSKVIIGRRAIQYCIEQGRIHLKDPATGVPTIPWEATSANTGDGMAEACAALGLPFHPVVKSDTPLPKIQDMEEWGPSIKVQLHSDLSETTVQRARRIGKLPGNCNPDQYAGDWNWQEQLKRLAPQLYGQTYEAIGGEPSLVFAPAGTMCTAMALQMYADAHALGTLVVPVMCGPGQEVPGARTLESIIQDVLFKWQAYFADRFEQGPRYESFLLSYLAFPALRFGLGPSFGLAFYGALSFLWKHKLTRTLDRFRKKDGKIYVVLFGPDSDKNYQHLFPAVLHFNDYAERRSVSLERLFGKAA